MYLAIFIALAFLVTFAYAGLRGAPWVPTWHGDVKRLLQLVALKPGQRFYDLGCGDGRLLAAAARAGARAEGFEVSLLPYLIALAWRLLARTPYIIRYQDFWSADLRDADVVYFFLMPRVYPRLQEKLEKELKKGVKVIAYVWPMPGWTPTHIDATPRRPNLYLYQR